MVTLYNDPSGDKIFENTNPSQMNDRKSENDSKNMVMRMADLSDADKVPLLQARVNVLEQKLDEKNRKISQLENFLST